MLSHRMSRHRENGSDRGLSHWFPITPFELSPNSRLKGVDHMEMEKGKISWEPTNLGDTTKQTNSCFRLCKILRIQNDLKKMIPVPCGVNYLAKKIRLKQRMGNCCWKGSTVSYANAKFKTMWNAGTWLILVKWGPKIIFEICLKCYLT